MQKFFPWFARTGRSRLLIAVAAAPRLALLLVMASLASTAAQAQDEVLRYVGDEQVEPLTVVTDTSLSAILVEDLARSFAEVEAVVAGQASPLDYELTEADRAAIAEADLVVYQGLGLMPAFIEAAEARDASDRVVLTDRIPEFRLIETNGAPNPHSYHSPALRQFAVDHLTIKLKDKLKPVAGEIEGNRLRVNIELQSLKRETEGLMEDVPRNERLIVTDNDVFAYFAKAYNFQLLNVTREEDGEKAVELIQRNQTPNVFQVKGAGDGAIEEWLAAHRGKDIPGSVAIAPSLTGLWLGDRNLPSGTYLGMFRQNVNDILLGLKPLPAAGQAEVE